MDDKDNQGKAGESCCAKKGCCGCKALAVAALLVVGGLGGFFWARHGCRTCAAPAPAAASPVK